MGLPRAGGDDGLQPREEEERVGRLRRDYSGFRFGVAALNQHKGHEGHQDKTTSFPFVSFVSIVFDQRSGSTTPRREKGEVESARLPVSYFFGSDVVAG